MGRIGIAEGKFVVPDEFSAWDKEIEEMFLTDRDEENAITLEFCAGQGSDRGIQMPE